MEWVYAIATLASTLAAVLAWAAKLQWAKEFRDAKDETIRAKEAQIELLKNEIQNFRDLTPMKIREYFISVREQLEEYNDRLKNQLEEKNQQISRLELDGQAHVAMVVHLQEEKAELEYRIGVNKALEKANTLKEFTVEEVSKDPAAVMDNVKGLLTEIASPYLRLVDLNDKTRQFMVDEIDFDIKNNTLYLSPRLSSGGRDDYPALLKEASINHDHTWLANELRTNGRMAQIEQRGSRDGSFRMVKVPVNAPETLAEGEFNRFYARALCRHAIMDRIANLIIYRAKEVITSRPESEAKIGTTVNAQELLDKLRINVGIDSALGMLSEPNSGLSVKLP